MFVSDLLAKIMLLGSFKYRLFSKIKSCRDLYIAAAKGELMQKILWPTRQLGRPKIIKSCLGFLVLWSHIRFFLYVYGII